MSENSSDRAVWLEKDITTAIEVDNSYEFPSKSEEHLLARLQTKIGWGGTYAKEVADLAWQRIHAENNPSPLADTADTRLLNLILELDSSNNLLPVLRGLPSDVWFKLFNAVETVGNGD